MKKQSICYCFDNYPLGEAGFADSTEIASLNITDGCPTRPRRQSWLVHHKELFKFNEVLKINGNTLITKSFANRKNDVTVLDLAAIHTCEVSARQGF